MNDIQMAIRNVLLIFLFCAWLYIFWAIQITTRGKIIKRSFSFRILP